MTKVMLNDLKGLNLEDLIITRLLIQGNSGSGKSYLLKRICEQSHGQIQQIIIDLEGEFAPLRARFDYVLMGPDGDVPIQVKYAKMLAQRIMKLAFSAIVDLSELERVEREEFLDRFLKELMKTPVGSRRPCLVAIDEAHLFAPQTGEAKSSKAVIDLMTRGRKRGLCGILLTQRLSKLNKDATAEINNKLIGRTFLDIDQKRAASELGIGKSEMLELRNLKQGQFYAFGTAISSDVIKVKIGKIVTSHGRAGLKTQKFNAISPGKAVKKILEKLGDIPHEFESEQDEIKSKDAQIRELKSKYRDLERSKPTPTVTQDDMDAAVAPIKTEFERQMAESNKKIQEEMQKYANAMMPRIMKLGEAFKNFYDIVKPIPELIKALGFAMDELDQLKKLGIEIPEFELQTPTQRRIVHNIVKKHVRTIPQSSDSQITGGALRMLEVLVTRYPMKFSKSQLGMLARVKHTGGSFGTYLSRLRTIGLVTDSISHDGSYLIATQEGIKFLGDNIPQPMSSDEVIEMWKNALGTGNGARRMFDILVDHYPHPLTKSDLGERSGINMSGGSFGTYLARLRSNSLIEVSGNEVKASEMLFN